MRYFYFILNASKTGFKKNSIMSSDYHIITLTTVKVIVLLFWCHHQFQSNIFQLQYINYHSLSRLLLIPLSFSWFIYPHEIRLLVSSQIYFFMIALIPSNKTVFYVISVQERILKMGEVLLLITVSRQV